MKNKFHKTSIRVLLVVLVLFTFTLSGCVRRSEETYFLRSIQGEYTMKFAKGDSEVYVTQNIELDNNFLGADVSWSSNKPNIISNTGVVTLPENDEEVTLTATFSVDNKKVTRKYTLKVISEESIKNLHYNDAYNKVLLLETKNNESTYESAKESLELVSEAHQGFNDLNNRFLVQKTVYYLGIKVREFINFPTTEKHTEINEMLATLPANNETALRIRTQIDNLESEIEAGNQLLVAINNKTTENYNTAKTKIEALTVSQTKQSLTTIINIIEAYLDDITLLETNTIDQTNLEDMVIRNLNNSLLNETDYALLKNLYHTNQKRILNNLGDLGYSYVKGKIQDYENEVILQRLDHTKENNQKLLNYEVVVDNLVVNYEGLLIDEIKAQHKITQLIHYLTEEALEAAKTANNLVASGTVKAANISIINEYENVVNINEDILTLEDIVSKTLNVESFKTTYGEINNTLNAITLEDNQTWLNARMVPYIAMNNVIAEAEDILTIPLAYDNTDTHPIVLKVNNAKRLNNDEALKDYAVFKQELASLIDQNVILRLKEISILQGKELKDSSILMGQLLGQTNNKHYDVQMLRAQKSNLDSSIRLDKSSLVVIRILIIFIVIVLFLVSQAITSDYADKKGYTGLVVDLISLIPIGGWYYFYKKEKRRNVSKEGFKQIYHPKEIIGKILTYSQIVIISVIVIVPIIYIFGMAFSDLKTDVPNTIWPRNPNVNSFKYLFKETKFGTWWVNTVLIAFVNMIIGTVLITGASYVFARFKFKGKKAGLLTILVLQSFPSFMGLIAMYVLFWKFGLLGRPLALTILYIGGGIPGNIWLIKGFLDQIPRDLDESAMIDGANKLQIFFKIIIPLAIPILTFVAVNLFMAPWMDYMLPGYLLNIPKIGAPADYDITQQWTLAVGLFKLIKDPYTLHYSAFAAGALIVGIPITLLYMFFQKYLIEGIMAGATKG